MTLFVRIETGVQSCSGAPTHQRFQGFLLTRELSAVAECELVDVTQAGKRLRRSRLPGYSCWTEPWLAVFARLLVRTRPRFLSEVPCELPLTISLGAGREFCEASTLERLRMTLEEDGLQVLMVTKSRSVLARAPSALAQLSLREGVLGGLLCAFGWHKRPGPVPAPLTDVRVFESLGGPVVAVLDLPSNLAMCLPGQFGLDPKSSTIPASLLAYFVGDDIRHQAGR
jgi:hypothetical protein